MNDRDGTRFRVEVAARPAEFGALWPRTDAAGEGVSYVFQCADLLDVWCDTIGRARGIKPCFVGVFDEAGRPVMLLALGIERQRGACVLTFLDDGVMDYNAPVLFPAAAGLDGPAMAEIWDAMRAALPRFDVALLEKMPERVEHLANPMLLLDTAPYGMSGHAMTLAGDWETVERSLPSRVGFRRNFRKLAEAGPLTMHVAQRPEEAETFFAAMVEQKARRFRETRVPGFEVPGKLDYFREATRRIAGGAVHLSVIKAGETIIATHWGLVFGPRFYHLMPSYAAGAIARHSPGVFHRETLTRWALENGYSLFDLGVGDEAYKLEFCDVTMSLRTATIPVTLAGKLHLGARSGLARLRATRAWQSVRPYKWAVLRALKRNGAG